MHILDGCNTTKIGTGWRYGISHVLVAGILYGSVSLLPITLTNFLSQHIFPHFSFGSASPFI